MNGITSRPAARPLDEAELARAAELAPGVVRELRSAFEAADRLGARYRAAGYRSVGRLVRRCGDEPQER